MLNHLHASIASRCRKRSTSQSSSAYVAHRRGVVYIQRNQSSELAVNYFLFRPFKRDRFISQLCRSHVGYFRRARQPRPWGMGRCYEMWHSHIVCKLAENWTPKVCTQEPMVIYHNFSVTLWNKMLYNLAGFFKQKNTTFWLRIRLVSTYKRCISLVMPLALPPPHSRSHEGLLVQSWPATAFS